MTLLAKTKCTTAIAVHDLTALYNAIPWQIVIKNVEKAVGLGDLWMQRVVAHDVWHETGTWCEGVGAVVGLGCKS